MEAAAKLGISVTIKQVGSDSTVGTSATVSSLERTNEWQPAYTLDEDGLLQQLRNTLVQTLDTSMGKFLTLSSLLDVYWSFVLFEGLFVHFLGFCSKIFFRQFPTVDAKSCSYFTGLYRCHN